MGELESNPEKRIALFQRKEVHRVIHDVVAALTDSLNPKDYFMDMRRREPQLAETLKGAAARCSNAGTPKASST